MSEDTRITSGTVMFEDAAKIDTGGDPQYWPTRRARVELTFSTSPNLSEDGVQSYVDEVIATARAKVAGMLGQPAPAVTNTARPGEAPAARKRRTRAEIEADEAAAKATTSAASGSEVQSGGESGGGATSADPSAIEEPAASQPAVEGPAAPDPTAMDEWESPPAEVTDADLNAAVQKKNAVLQDPPKIRSLIGSYNPDPTKVFQLREIPQAKRAEFLAKLEQLK